MKYFKIDGKTENNESFIRYIMVQANTVQEVGWIDTDRVFRWKPVFGVLDLLVWFKDNTVIAEFNTLEELKADIFVELL